SLMIHFLCITLVMLRILSEPDAIVWAMAHKKALPGQGFVRSVSIVGGGGWALPPLTITPLLLPGFRQPPPPQKNIKNIKNQSKKKKKHTQKKKKKNFFLCFVFK
ncbi:hypothetical protein, partial [Enterobacter mori]